MSLPLSHSPSRGPLAWSDGRQDPQDPRGRNRRWKGSPLGGSSRDPVCAQAHPTAQRRTILETAWNYLKVSRGLT